MARRIERRAELNWWTHEQLLAELSKRGHHFPHYTPRAELIEALILEEIG